MVKIQTFNGGISFGESYAQCLVLLVVYRVIVMVLISNKKENVEPIVLVTVTTYIYLDVPTFASSKSMW